MSATAELHVASPQNSHQGGGAEGGGEASGAQLPPLEYAVWRLLQWAFEVPHQPHGEQHSSSWHGPLPEPQPPPVVTKLQGGGEGEGGGGEGGGGDGVGGDGGGGAEGGGMTQVSQVEPPTPSVLPTTQGPPAQQLPLSGL